MITKYSDTIKPRISDINYGGHVGLIELSSLLHQIRVQFLNKNNMSELDINGYGLVMRELNLKYLNQVFWDNELKVEMDIQDDGAKIIFNYTVNNLTLKNKTAEALATMVLVDKVSQKPVKPDHFFEKIHNGTESSENIRSK